MILQSCQAPFNGLPKDLIERYARQAQETSNGLTVPPPARAYFGITDAKQAEWIKRFLTPHPFQTYLTPLRLTNPVGNGLPASYIACSKPLFAATAKSREAAKAPKWIYQEIPCGHDAMLLLPGELTQMLLQIG